MVRFILDCMLGKLARWLRILGYDAEYLKEEDEEILRLADGRVLLTRDRELAERGRKRGLNAILLKSTELKAQLRELSRDHVINAERDRMFTRCPMCNSLLECMEVEEVDRSRIPTKSYSRNKYFYYCRRCDKYYWKGSHWEKIALFLQEFTDPDIPGYSECIEILENSNCSPEVIAHSRAVSKLAIEIAVLSDADIALVSSGALLHDIGRSKNHGIEHLIEGVKIAEQLGLPEEIIGIIRSHVGGGLDEEEARTLGLPAGDYIPRTIEQKIVCHADSLIAGKDRQKLKKAVKSLEDKGFIKTANRVRAMHLELSDICDIDLDLLVE